MRNSTKVLLNCDIRIRKQFYTISSAVTIRCLLPASMSCRWPENGIAECIR